MERLEDLCKTGLRRTIETFDSLERSKLTYLHTYIHAYIHTYIHTLFILEENYIYRLKLRKKVLLEKEV